MGVLGKALLSRRAFPRKCIFIGSRTSGKPLTVLLVVAMGIGAVRLERHSSLLSPVGGECE
jgi:hypothetical protein